jgi:hypothetical protein
MGMYQNHRRRTDWILKDISVGYAIGDDHAARNTEIDNEPCSMLIRNTLT